MYERMLDKEIQPTEQQAKAYVGESGWQRLNALEQALQGRYDLTKELRFPFGNNYGWGIKYSHRKSHLCYAFYEKGAFTVMLQIGDAQVKRMEEILPSLQPATQMLWENRYPCGEKGGWVQLRATRDADVVDAVKMLEVKKRPQKTS